MKKIFLILVCALALGGCSHKVELEDRSFVMAAGIDKWADSLKLSYAFPDYSQVTEQDKGTEEKQDGTVAKSFYEGELKFNASSDKVLNYAHLKAIILSKDMLRYHERLFPMLRYLENENVISANTLIFVCDGRAADIINTDGQVDGSLGIYLKDMYESNQYLTEQKSVTLGDMIRHWHNGDETLLIPVLKVKEKKPEISSYAILHNMAYKGDMSIKQSDLLFLAKGIKADYYTQIEGYDIQIRPGQTEYSFQTSGKTPGIRTDLKFEMRIPNGVNLDKTMLKKLKTMTEDELESGISAVLEKGQKDYGIDLLNSYLLLASRDRELWMAYRDRQKEYEKAVQFHISCQGTQL